MTNLQSELMKLDNLKFDDDVSNALPITLELDEKEKQRVKQREYNARYNAKKKLLASKKAKATPAKVIPSTSLSKNPSAEQLVNTMSIGMAKAVYLELKKVFEA